jgi:uncharacterized protein YdaU (DUF1376 family)
MKKPPAFLFYPDNWVGGTSGLTFEEQGIYLRLLCFQWNNGPFTDDELRSFLRPFSRQIRAKIKHVLSAFFYQNCDKKWHNSRLEIERQKMLAKSEKAAISAKSRWSGDKPTGEEGMRTHDANGYARGHAPAMLSNSNTNTKEDQEANSRVLDRNKKQVSPNCLPSSREQPGKNGTDLGKQFPTGEQNPIPEPLKTPEFLSAWQRWQDFRFATDGRLNPIQLEVQLKTCLERGVAKAVRDIEASIAAGSKGAIYDSSRFNDQPERFKPLEPNGYTPEDVLDCFRFYFGGEPQMTPSRLRAISDRLSDGWWYQNFKEACEMASKLDFCNGKNRNKWTATIDWFIQPDTATKILEGSYGQPKKDPYAGFPGMSS